MSNSIIMGGGGPLPTKPLVDKIAESVDSALDMAEGPYAKAVEWCDIDGAVAVSQLPKAKLALAALEDADEQFRALDGSYSLMTRPATVDDIQQELGILIGTRTQSGVGDVRLYGRMLGEDVGAAEPSIGALSKACTVLRREKQFMPSIAEVLAQIAVETKTIKAWGHMSAKLPERIAELRDLIAAAEARPMAVAAE